jgi:predicted RNA-binding protein with PUA-like domain
VKKKARSTPPPARFLAKSEPEVYSIDDLARDGKTGWEGVRNFQARNTLRSAKTGDLVLFYHSNAEPSGVAGIAKVVRAAYPDPTQFVKGGEYEDPTSKPDDPRWSTIDVAFVEKFPTLVPLAALKEDEALAGLEVARKGSRLSVHPVTPEHFEHICALGRKKKR